MIEVMCLHCGEKIGEYNGPLGITEEIDSQKFVRLDGSSPPHNSPAFGHCPHCATKINEFEAVLSAIWEALDKPTAVIIENPES